MPPPKGVLKIGAVKQESTMHKIASPRELQSEIHRLLVYAGSEKPSRVKLAAELRALADRVASTERTASVDVLDYLVDQNELSDIYDKLSEDQQSADLFVAVYHKLGNELKLSSGGQEALSRVLDIVRRGKNWQIDLLRNNVFKAANALGMHLPSGMF
jgi:thioredoxin-like negative regulator of GroEL